MQAERELICRLLQSQRMGRVLAGGIEPEHFHSYRAEYEYLFDQWNKHSELPPVKIFRERFPDFPYRKIVGKDPSVAPAVEAVMENHLELELATLAEQFVNQLGDKKPTELLNMMTNKLDLLRASEQGEEQVDILADIMTDVEEFERLQRAEIDGNSAFVPAPWQPINDYWGGFRAGELIAVIGRINEGKSWIGVQAAGWATYKANQRPFIAPLEMSRFDVACRLHTLWSYWMAKDASPKHMKLPAITNRARVAEMMEGRTVWSNSGLAMGSNKIDIEEYRKWAEAAKQMMPKGMVMPNMNASSGPFNLDSFIRHIERSECDIAVLDYLTLLDTGTQHRDRSGWEVWSEITRRLKMTAMRLQIPIVVMGQANRNGAFSRTPELTDIAFSDAFGQNADRILSIKQTGERMAVTCIKNRIGQKRFRFWLNFVPDFGVLEYDKHVGVEEDFDE